MNLQGTLAHPARRRAPAGVSVAVLVVLAGAALFAVQSCVDPPAAAPPTPKPTPTAPTSTTPPPTPPPTPSPYPPPPT